jgi:hypothetical protein
METLLFPQQCMVWFSVQVCCFVGLIFLKGAVDANLSVYILEEKPSPTPLECGH